MSKVIVDSNSKIKNWGLYYNKNKFIYEEDKKKSMSKDEKKKLKSLLQKLDDLEQAEYKLSHSKGYCPHCHCLLPLNGICDFCD